MAASPRTEHKSFLVNYSPNIITLAVSFAFAYEASTSFIQIRVTVSTFETASVPFEIGCNSEDVLVVDLRAASNTH